MKRFNLRAIANDERGNVLMLLGFALVPLTFAVGMGIDYSRAQHLQTQMNAAADAAALAGVDATIMQETDATAQDVATKMFLGQVARLDDKVFSASDLNVVVTPAGALNEGRTVTVTYKAKSMNIFASLLGWPTLPVGGTAEANSAKAPYIDFYLAMDKSPSMLLPWTSDGISRVINATKTSALPNGCAFACHAQDPHSDNIYIRDSNGADVLIDQNYYNSSGTGSSTWYRINTTTKKVLDAAGTVIGSTPTVSGSSPATVSFKDLSNRNKTLTGYYADGYWLTHNYPQLYPGSNPIELRVSAETRAAKDLIPFAQSMATRNQVDYRMAIHSFDWTHPGKTSPVYQSVGLTNVKSLGPNNVPDLDGSQDWWFKNNLPSSSNNTNDKATEFLVMLNGMNGIIPDPGTGKTANDPQKVLFIVTDGLPDEAIGGSRYHRELASQHQKACSDIKARGIKIAILYTRYLPESLTGDSWSQSNVAPYLPNVLAALQQCASPARDGSPLVYTVGSDESISTALTALFAQTVQSARLLR